MFTDEQIKYFRQELNISPDTLMINNGSWGALSKAALDAYVEALYTDSLIRRANSRLIMQAMMEYLEEDRKEVATLLNCDTDEVALTESTTYGMNICLWGIDMQPGDEILSCKLENGAGFGLLKTIAARRKVKINYIDIGRWAEKDAVKAVEKTITPQTKAVMLSHVIYVNGAILDAKGISEVCRKRGIPTVFDGVQAAGTMKIDMKDMGCDAYCISRQKFLNGPDGAGAFYIRKESYDQFQPTFAGVFNDEYHGFKIYKPNYHGSRFDVTTRPYPVQAAAAATMKWHREKVGYDKMYEQIHSLRAMLFDIIETIPGAEVNSLKESKEGALIHFSIKDIPPQTLSDYLLENKIGNRVVNHWYGPDFSDDEMSTGVRVSVSFWNTIEDMKNVASIIRKASKL